MGNIKKSFIVSSAVALVIALLIVTAFDVSFKRNPAKKYQNAKACIEENNFNEAAQLLYNFDYKDSKQILNNICGENPELVLYGLETGDTVFFGNYKGEPLSWNVLDFKNGELLLQTSKVVDQKIYNENHNKEKDDGTQNSGEWNETTLCQWLNTQFLNEAFNENERNAICQNGPEKTYSFILTYDETRKYNIEEQGVAEPTRYAVSMGAKIEADGKAGIMYRGKWKSQFLGLDYVFDFEVSKFKESSNKNDDYYWSWDEGDVDSTAYGVRPCIWIKPTVLE